MREGSGSGALEFPLSTSFGGKKGMNWIMMKRRRRNHVLVDTNRYELQR
jgi:hypothetical protein